ncbi:MAG: hypothetical protein ACJAVA_002541 [Flavobacteriaceae bacterium]|jgi:hypothetical protein
MIHYTSIDIDGEEILLEIHVKKRSRNLSLSKFERDVIECAMTDILIEFDKLAQEPKEE